MINFLRRRLFSVRHNYLNPIDRQRASVLLLINWTIALAMVAWLLVGVMPIALQGQEIPLQSLIALTLTLTLNVVIYRQIQTGRLQGAIWLFVSILLLNTVLLTVFWSPDGQTSVSGTFAIVLVLPLVAAGVLLNRRGMVLIALILLAVVIYAGIGQSQTTTPFTFVPAESIFIDIPIIFITLLLILTFLLVFAGNLERIANQSLVDIQQRQWITEFGIELGSLPDENRVLVRALEVLRDRFQYIFAQVYLLDEEGRFHQVMRPGMNQTENITREGLNLGEANIITQAAQTSRTVLVSSDDPLPRRGHLLAAANYGIAIPIRHGAQVLGVFDVQSAGQVGFSQNEIQALALVADQTGIALNHARIVADLERGLREQVIANRRLQEQVAEYSQRERRGVIGAWSQYLEGRGKTAIGYNIEPDNTATPIPANDLPDSIQHTLRSGTVQVETEGDERIINVPITFRDQTLGAMSFAVPKDQQLNERQVEMARVVAERLALALENTRLFEQSQAQALRERKASEINTLLIGATDVSSVLNLAAENFNQALGAIHTRIYIQPGMLSEPLAETNQQQEVEA
jgi:GAF domain-containing protein